MKISQAEKTSKAWKHRTKTPRKRIQETAHTQTRQDDTCRHQHPQAPAGPQRVRNTIKTNKTNKTPPQAKGTFRFHPSPTPFSPLLRFPPPSLDPSYFQRVRTFWQAGWPPGWENQMIPKPLYFYHFPFFEFRGCPHTSLFKGCPHTSLFSTFPFFGRLGGPLAGKTRMALKPVYFQRFPLFQFRGCPHTSLFPTFQFFCRLGCPLAQKTQMAPKPLCFQRFLLVQLRGARKHRYFELFQLFGRLGGPLAGKTRMALKPVYFERLTLFQFRGCPHTSLFPTFSFLLQIGLPLGSGNPDGPETFVFSTIPTCSTQGVPANVAILNFFNFLADWVAPWPGKPGWPRNLHIYNFSHFFNSGGCPHTSLFPTFQLFWQTG